jgi:hypothetical protein
MFDGVRCPEIMVQTVLNKRQFFKDHDAEFLVYVDEHEPIDPNVLDDLRSLSDSLTIRKHTKRYRQWDEFNKFNDINYNVALSQARGDLVVHFDGDTSCFAKDKAAVDRWLGFLDTYKFVSYPSHWSPGPTVDESFEDKWWVSTRAFACHRDTLDFTEIEKCLMDGDYMWGKYGKPNRACHWFEHILALINGHSTIYPPMTDDLLMFCWSRYAGGVLTKLNQMPFDDVKAYVRMAGGIVYPNDVQAMPL